MCNFANEHRAALGIAMLLTLFAGRASAQVTIIESDGTQPVIYRMTVSPAAEPKPALKYHFLVPPVDQIHENAATLYYKAMTHAEQETAFRHYMELESNDEKWESLFSGPLDKLPQKEVEDYVGWLAFDSIREAARYDRCDWVDDIRRHGISTLLPQAQSSRTYCHLLALRTRLQIAQKKLDDAVETLLAGYAWSRNLGHSPTLVQCLIGMAFQSVLDEQTAALIAAENPPNLYWALTDLAEQPIELRQALSFESKLLEFTIHPLADLDQRVFTPEEALEIVSELPVLMSFRNDSPRNIGHDFFWAVQLQPEARKYLHARGFTADKLDAMPVLQEVLLYRWKQFEIVRDDCFKWLKDTDRDVSTAQQRFDNAVKAAVLRGEGLPFTNLLPAIFASEYARQRSMRFTDMLRIVEALRMYAAEHGHWPERLSDITAVPIPVDPYSKKPFQYSVKDGVAILEPPAGAELPGGAPASHRYELTLRKPAK